MFVLITHPDVENAAVVSERAAAAYAAKGWQLDEIVAEPTAAREEAPRELKRPQKNDSTAAWRTYAVAVEGLTVAEAFDKSRDELVELYAPPAKAAPATPTAPKES